MLSQLKSAKLKLNQSIFNLKQAEENLKKLAVELDRSNKELEQFATIASHDLQEPLRVITMYLELLKRRYQGRLDKDADEFIDFAMQGANESQKLIRDLLEYSRIGAGKPFKATDFESVLRQALAHLELLVMETGAEITHRPLPQVMADSFQMVRLFQNLLSNAIKYRSERPLKIHVAAQKEGREWIFSVKDNGIGIDTKYQERIFEIFQRLHSKSQGSGIGLAVCKKIVERHGGKIWVDSKVDAGATFYFSLPVRVLTAEEMPAAQAHHFLTL